MSTVGEEFTLELGKMLDAARSTGTDKPYVGNAAVQWGRIDLDAVSTAPFTANDVARYRLQPGDLLVCEGGEVGRAAIWDASLDECYFQKAIHRLRSRGSYRPELLMYYLSFWQDTDHLDEFTARTSIAHLPKEKFERVPLPAPPRTEQARIVGALGDTDDLIESLERLIDKKQGVLTATRQLLLTEALRLPSFGQDWRERPLRDLCDVVPGGTPDTGVAAYWDGDIPWCTPTDITAGHGRYLDATSRTITKKGLKASSARLLPEGALLLCTRATIGELKLAKQPIATNQGFKSLVCGSDVDPTFVYFLLTQRRRDIEALGSGSTFDEVGTSDLKVMALRVPELAEQRAITEILADMDDEITALRGRLEKTRAVKQGMIRELLTGRTRLAAEEGAA